MYSPKHELIDEFLKPDRLYEPFYLEVKLKVSTLRGSVLTVTMLDQS